MIKLLQISPLSGCGFEKSSYRTYDHLGSTRMVLNPTDLNGVEVDEAYAYTAYGEQIPLTGQLPQPNDRTKETFTGKEYDQEGSVNGVGGINLDYFGARYYDPEVGIWLSADKASQFWNAYGYPTNPILMVDPDGNFSWIPVVMGAAMGAIQGGMNAAANDQNVGLGIFGGAVVGGASGALGSWVGDFSNVQILSSMMSSVAASTANSIGMYAISGGKTDISTSYGPFTMNWSNGKFDASNILGWFNLAMDINSSLPYPNEPSGDQLGGAGEGMRRGSKNVGYHNETYAGAGGTRPGTPVRYIEDRGAILHDQAWKQGGIHITNGFDGVRGNLDRRGLAGNKELFHFENSVARTAGFDAITRTAASQMRAYAGALIAIQSVGYLSWFQQ